MSSDSSWPWNTSRHFEFFYFYTVIHGVVYYLVDLREEDTRTWTPNPKYAMIISSIDEVDVYEEHFMPSTKNYSIGHYVPTRT